jgi:hypothetical protein
MSAGATIGARIAFAAVWTAVQGALIATAGDRPDAAFGFRMFSESSTIEIHLSREILDNGETRIVPVHGGAWAVADKENPDGPRQERFWKDRVHEPVLTEFDRAFPCSYSAEAQLSRWHAALNDVASHLQPDGETQRLILDITIHRNGHDAVVTAFTSEPVAQAPSAP